MTMKPRRTSEDLLPRSPLEFAHPLHVHGPGAEGAAILAELPLTDAATVLRLLRLVLAFGRGPAGAPVLRRGALERWEAAFHAHPDHPLWGPAITILAQLGAGEGADAAMVAQSCVAVADWLLEQGAWQSALLFAQAAALAFPQNARMAWMAGRMLRNHGRMREAELWLRRAYRVAAWTRDVETQDLALNSLGNLFAQQGCYKKALAILNRALKLALRLNRQRRGAVNHDLFAVCVLSGDHARAERFALAAFELYGDDHPNLPKLAHDVAQLWVRQGRFTPALPVLKALLPYLRLPYERLRVLSSVARTAAAVGDLESFEMAWDEAWKLVSSPDSETRAAMPGAYVDLGSGAASLAQWENASRALTLAVELARERGAHEDASRAEAGLALVRRHERIEREVLRPYLSAVRLADAFTRSLESLRESVATSSRRIDDAVT